MKQFSVLVCAGVVTSILAGCAGTPDHAAPSTIPNTTSAAQQTEQEAGADQLPAPADPLTCLHGTWLADNAFFLERIREFGDEVREVSGQVFLRFDADGALATEYQDWTISAIAEGVDVEIVRVGVDTGTYVASGGDVHLNETEIGSMLTVRRGSVEMPIHPAPATYQAAAYSCSENAAEIRTADGALRLSRN